MVSGPAGVPVEWEVLCASSAPPTGVEVHMSYDPPAGELGHNLAALLGADPKSVMDEDLARFKSLIEHGRTQAPGGAGTRENIR